MLHRLTHSFGLVQAAQEVRPFIQRSFRIVRMIRYLTSPLLEGLTAHLER